MHRMSLCGLGLVVASLTASFLASSASAGTISLFLQNGNDGGQPFNTTEFRIANTSAPGVSLTGFAMTVGDAAQYNFDQIYQGVELFSGGDGTQTASLLIGDRVQDGAVTDSFEYGFTNFGPGVLFRGQFDIDLDSGVFDVNARTVLFNNGDAPNSVITCTFSDGSSFAYEFPDLPSLDSYTLTIPTPGTLAMLAAGGLVTRRRRAR